MPIGLFNAVPCEYGDRDEDVMKVLSILEAGLVFYMSFYSKFVDTIFKCVFGS